VAHHFAQQRPRETQESVPWTIARSVFVWNFIGSDPDVIEANQVEPGDMALNEDEDSWVYTGLAWVQIDSSQHSEHTYVFLPDAAKGADIAVGNQQGILHHSGDQEEMVTAVYLDSEAAPTGANLIVVLEYGDTDNLDTVGSWTTIDTVTLTATNKSVKDSTPTQATLPANRLIRMNVDQVGSTVAGADAAVHMKVKRKLTT
jgi:hypothetical protein